MRWARARGAGLIHWARAETDMQHMRGGKHFRAQCSREVERRAGPRLSAQNSSKLIFSST
eukprot:1390700-Pyramimonas_sp.AAC.1